MLVTVTALGDLWSHQLTLSSMPVCPFYDKVVLTVVGCSAVGALLHCMYSVVALRPESLCYILTSRSLGKDREFENSTSSQ